MMLLGAQRRDSELVYAGYARQPEARPRSVRRVPAGAASGWLGRACGSSVRPRRIISGKVERGGGGRKDPRGTGASALKRRKSKRFWPRAGHRRPHPLAPSRSPYVVATQIRRRIDNRRRYNMALPSSSLSGIRGIAFSSPDSSPRIPLAEDAKVTIIGTTPERKKGWYPSEPFNSRSVRDET
jgi:hypothetical protein